MSLRLARGFFSETSLANTRLTHQHHTLRTRSFKRESGNHRSLLFSHSSIGTAKPHLFRRQQQLPERTPFLVASNQRTLINAPNVGGINSRGRLQVMNNRGRPRVTYSRGRPQGSPPLIHTTPTLTGVAIREVASMQYSFIYLLRFCQRRAAITTAQHRGETLVGAHGFPTSLRLRQHNHEALQCGLIGRIRGQQSIQRINFAV